jgi:chromate transporter
VTVVIAVHASRAYIIAAVRSQTDFPVPSFSDATRTWMRIGLLSFGGPAGQIAVMHRILVEEKRWIGESRFMHALNYCMLLPGPEAQQLATYIGWLLHGTRGGLVAGTLFVVPGFLAILVLSVAYVSFREHPLLDGVLLGLKAAVIALVLQALVRLGRRALATGLSRALALGAFVAIAVLRIPFPLVIIGSGCIGYLAARAGRVPVAAADASAIEAAEPELGRVEPSARRALNLLALWLPLWFGPVVLCAALFGAGHVFTQLGVFFSKMAVVTFGGAYAVLAYVAQEAAGRYAWISPAQMVDGLGLAESTPGPLILVVQFVGFLAAYQTSGAAWPLAAGVGGALLTVWVTFVPCFLWIFLGAPYIERLRGNRALANALAAITAAVVGVIANLALWFAIHVLFARQETYRLFGSLTLELPDLSTVQLAPTLLMLVGVSMLLVLRQSLARTLALCMGLGIAFTFA